jgi:hypothetical protein
MPRTVEQGFQGLLAKLLYVGETNGFKTYEIADCSGGWMKASPDAQKNGAEASISIPSKTGLAGREHHEVRIQG